MLRKDRLRRLLILPLIIMSMEAYVRFSTVVPQAITIADSMLNEQDAPTIYLITPTYKRKSQAADLLKNCQTFRQVDKLHWIVVEDSVEKTDLVTNMLEECGLYDYTHLNIKTPNKGPNRGIFQRNLGMEWIRANVDRNSTGVFYFADDDNTYDTDLFEYMRHTRKLSAWPVGLVGGLLYEGPVLNGTDVVWITNWMPNRVLPIDMAGFAMNIRLLFEKENGAFSLDSGQGQLESDVLRKFGLSRTDATYPCKHLNRVLVWHVKAQLL